MINENIQKQLTKLPVKPGVYRYFDATNNLLYIGKAISLKRRVGSYFQKRQIDPRIEDLVAKITHIEWTETGSVIEALILEANEINTKQPPYNVRQKDDKTFATIVITKEKFPRVMVTRPSTQKVKTPLEHVFGPYTSADQARLALQIIRKIFPFRANCKVGERPGRGCLDYQLGLCPGSCADALTQIEYKKILRRVILFLEGKKQLIVRNLTREMKNAAKVNDFEQAARLRNQLFALDHIRDVALLRKEDLTPAIGISDRLPNRIEAYDISNTGAGYAVGSMVVISHGKKEVNQYRKFQIKTIVGQNDIAMMREILTRRFQHVEWPLPQLVIIDGGEAHFRMAKRTLARLKINVSIIAAAKGPERKKLDLYGADSSMRENSELIDAIRLARDEAHRFAITYHRTHRDKGFLNG